MAYLLCAARPSKAQHDVRSVAAADDARATPLILASDAFYIENPAART
jgi:hypothetical protein